MASAATTVTQASSVLLAAFSTIAVLLQRYLDHPVSEYEDKVRELQESAWRSVCGSLGELFVHVQRGFDPTDVAKEDAPLEAKYGMFIKSQYNRGLLGDLEDALASMDEPKLLYRDCRKNYDSTFWMFVLSLLASGPAFIFVSLTPNVVVLVVSSTLLGVGVALFFRGLLKTYNYWKARRELDEMWEEHHLY